ncbi:Major facilitator superfamily, general substrate transporter [Penicillium camemberti]|uniref:Major facilitator superfamily, general substrate transporter n=1 Tax=Penicillium camemberti (strain FM 013) TaxID=1429867 RepID=A0A0G4P1M7_PENC3|nr:Major facilitator superfamily, general substrate transporter [Penicillium camemberti]
MSTDGTLTETHDPSLINSTNSPDSENGTHKEVIPEWKKSKAPDGGLAAWSVVLGSWCVLFCTFGWINSVGVFQNYYESTLLSQYSASTIAWIPSLQIFFMYAMGPVSGHLYDNYGPRYSVLFGSLLHVFGLMMCSISTKYYQILLSQGVCSAIGVSIIFQPTYGLMSTGSSVGGVIFPIMIQQLIPEVGFAWAMRAGAFVILFLLTTANLTIRSRLPPSPRPVSRAALTQPLKETKMLLVIAGFTLLTFGVYIPIDYLVVEGLSSGISTNLSQYLLAILNAGSFFGRLGAGMIADQIGTYNVFAVVCYLAGIFILAIWIPATGAAGTIVFAVLFGCCSGAYVSLAAALVVKISPLPQIGYRVGLIFLFASIGGLTTNPIDGAILSHDNGTYLGMKVFAGVLLLAGTTCVFGTRLLYTGLKLVAKF